MKTSTRQWLDFAKADLLNCERILAKEFYENAKKIFDEISKLID